MEIKRAGTQPSANGPTDWFTGTVRIDPLFHAPDPGRATRELKAAALGALGIQGTIPTRPAPASR